MKKFILAFLTVGMVMAGCSSDEPEDYSFESNILIDGEAFIPSPHTNILPSLMTSRINFGNGRYRRYFHLIRYGKGGMVEREMELYVDYPDTISADGTYSMDIMSATGKNFGGEYRENDTLFVYEQGTVTIEEAGKDRFGITFDNVKAVSPFDGAEKTISGHFDGKFAQYSVHLD